VLWIAGTPHAGKSLLFLYLVLALATQRTEAAGRFAIQAHPRILYVAREDGRGRTKVRRADILCAWGVPLAAIRGLRFIHRQPVNVLDAADRAGLVAECQRDGATVLVLDTWTALTPGTDPDSPKEQAVAAAAMVALADAVGLVVVIDHARKNPPAGVSAADLYGPNQKAQRAEHLMILRKVDAEDRRVEVLFDSKDLDGERRYYLERSPEGSGTEKWLHAGPVTPLGDRSRQVGLDNRDRVLAAVPSSPAWVSREDIEKALLTRGVKLGSSAIKDHLRALVLVGKVDQAGKARASRYQRIRESAEPSAETASTESADSEDVL
jgi:hypothetical protein